MNGASARGHSLPGPAKKRISVSSLLRKVIGTTRAPATTGPAVQLCQGVRTTHISAQLVTDPSGGWLVPGGEAEEAERALTNVGEIWEAAGCDFTNVVKTTVWLAYVNDFNTVNEIYKWCCNFPARGA